MNEYQVSLQVYIYINEYRAHQKAKPNSSPTSLLSETKPYSSIQYTTKRHTNDPPPKIHMQTTRITSLCQPPGGNSYETAETYAVSSQYILLHMLTVRSALRINLHRPIHGRGTFRLRKAAQTAPSIAVSTPAVRAPNTGIPVSEARCAHPSKNHLR